MGAGSAQVGGGTADAGGGTAHAGGRPLVLVHGFTQTGASWGELGRLAGRAHAVCAVDAPGHGDSAGVAVGLAEGADRIVDTAGRAAYLGYSMGARFVLHAALRHPEAVERLILISASAGIDEPAERARRQESDGQLAERVEAEGVDAFVRWWLRGPLWATLPEHAAETGSRLANTAPGLASSLRLAGAGSAPPLWDRLGEVSAPALILAGGLDDAYVARAERLVATLPDARLAIIAGAGHACHLEQPAAVWAAVEPFLA
jgi:2-succinyl-6-hydroxy-2,4-cyclohexadiene-1-carboxylate synthase